MATTDRQREKSPIGPVSRPDSRFQRVRENQRAARAARADRGLEYALAEIDRMASALGVPRSARQVAGVVYRRARAENKLRGRSIEGVCSAALYAGCRKEHVPRGLAEVAGVSRADLREIGRTYRRLASELGLGMEPVDPEQYVSRFCELVEASDQVERVATEIVERTVEQGLLSGKSPTGYAGAAIYAAAVVCDQRVTQREVADAAQVTEVTIRNRYREQLEAVGDEIGVDA
jgi:transcription initiation factor TFIIB